MKLVNYSTKSKSAVPVGRALCVRTIDKSPLELLLRPVVHLCTEKMSSHIIATRSDHANDLVLTAIDERLQLALHFCLHLVVSSCCGDELDPNSTSELLVLRSLYRLRLREFNCCCPRGVVATSENEVKAQKNQNRDVFLHFRLLSRYDLIPSRHYAQISLKHSIFTLVRQVRQKISISAVLVAINLMDSWIKKFSSPKMRNRQFVFTPKIEYQLVAERSEANQNSLTFPTWCPRQDSNPERDVRSVV